MKTRAENSEAPLEKATGSHLIQANFQMCGTGAQVLFLQSYLPENKSSNFFFLQRNDLLIDVMKEITDHIFKQEVVSEWHYDEESYLSKMGKQLLGNIPSFETLRLFRMWVNQMAKKIKKVVFHVNLKK